MTSVFMLICNSGQLLKDKIGLFITEHITLIFCYTVFKSIGCWKDDPNRAIELLEGKHRLLKDPDYKVRVNALMKCADAARNMSLVMFAVQNGGQCFGGINAEKSFRKYGPSTACCGR